MAAEGAALAAAAKVILLAGPTASGKSALALRLAEAVGGEIVNADALQVYRELRLLTARPSAEEEARAPHHLFGTIGAAEPWSVGRWLRAALPILQDLQARGRTAIVTGGTGLYFQALTQGLADIPHAPPEIRRRVQALYDDLGEPAFRQRLAAADPLAEARISPGDRQRLGRALEVHESTGRPLSAWQADTVPALPAHAWTGVVLEPPRAELYARCDARLEAMVELGALEEVRALLELGLPPTQPALKAVGVRELTAHLLGELSLAGAIALAQQQTRRYAKRQLTWLRNQTLEWPRITALESEAQWDALLARLAR